MHLCMSSDSSFSALLHSLPVTESAPLGEDMRRDGPLRRHRVVWYCVPRETQPEGLWPLGPSVSVHVSVHADADGSFRFQIVVVSIRAVGLIA